MRALVEKGQNIMATLPVLRIAIADGEHARFVQPDADNELRTVGSLDSASAHLRSRDIGSDKPGRSFESSSSTRHGVGPRHDLHAMAKERFIQAVAEQLNAASASEEFSQLVLVAPARALGELRDGLDAGARAKLIGTLEKDLVKTPDHELSPHLREWVPPPHRVGA
jgi:protein required for attachment to host cells